jgi:methylated-DNA-protein-cysteine methyltransferase-like protein
MKDFEAIYAVVRSIPPGRVMSYGQVGAEAGATARTVGWALTNTPEDVPWQRVVGYDGYLNIARRDPDLRRLQEALLAEEGVTVSEAGYVERRFFVGEEDTGLQH